MKFKSLFAIICTLLFISAPVFAKPITITDQAGRRVEIPAAPERVVCIGPGALRMIVYLEATEMVVGVEAMEKQRPEGRPYRIAHPELAELPTIGPGGPAAIDKKPDMEAMMRVRPQVIFAAYMSPANADAIQKTLRIPVVILSYGELGTFVDTMIFEALQIVGKVLHREARAETLINWLKKVQTDLQKRTDSIPDKQKPGVFVGGVGHRGAHGIESTNRVYVPLDWLNAVNLAKTLPAPDHKGSHLFINKEMLLKLNPDVIFVDGGGLALVKADYQKNTSFYNALKAFQERRVYALLPFKFYTTNIGTAIANAYTLGKRLYPNAFEDIDPKRKADDIYTFMVGKPVYSAMEKEYGEIGREMPLE